MNAAWQIARFTAEDPCAGLPDPDTLATSQPDLKVFHEWPITVDDAVEIARRAERAAFDTSPAIANSEGASVTVSHGHFVAANSLGFAGGYRYSRHSIACAPIARRRGEMQRDDWYSSHCNPKRLADPEALGSYAAERALARLGARRLPTRRVPVLLEAPLACGLLGHFVQAASGGALYRKASFLVDSLGQALFPAHVDIVEDPHLLGESGSTPFDNEGVHPPANVVRQTAEGLLPVDVLGAQAGHAHRQRRRLAQQVREPRDAARRLVRKMLAKLGTGLLVTDLMGQGVNYVTGDYLRRGGFWVGRADPLPGGRDHDRRQPADMFRGIVAIGADDTRAKRSGSVLIDEMAVAGS